MFNVKKVGFLDFLLDFCWIIGFDWTDKLDIRRIELKKIQSNPIIQCVLKIQLFLDFWSWIWLDVQSSIQSEIQKKVDFLILPSIQPRIVTSIKQSNRSFAKENGSADSSKLTRVESSFKYQKLIHITALLFFKKTETFIFEKKKLCDQNLIFFVWICEIIQFQFENPNKNCLLFGFATFRVFFF
jgi:hypothetical protein